MGSRPNGEEAADAPAVERGGGADVMVMRIVLFLLGAAAAGGGGYVTWLNRALAPQLFPPNPHNPPWMLVAGLAADIVGLVLVVAAAWPRGPSKAARAEEAA